MCVCVCVCVQMWPFSIVLSVQVDVIGVHAQDIIHPQDYQEVNAIFQSQGRDSLGKAQS